MLAGSDPDIPSQRLCVGRSPVSPPSGLEVDHQFKLDWGLDGKLTRFLALEDAIDISRRKPKFIALLTSVE